jgi:hypothetical protein
VSTEFLYPGGTDSGHGDLGPVCVAGGLVGSQDGE